MQMKSSPRGVSLRGGGRAHRWLLSIACLSAMVLMAPAAYPQTSYWWGASLTVTINPAGARDAGAQWQMDGGAYRNSGVTVKGVAPGYHTVSFKPINGWAKPGDARVFLWPFGNSSLSGTYTQVTQTGALTVAISPVGAVTAGAQWRVDSLPEQRRNRG